MIYVRQKITSANNKVCCKELSVPGGDSSGISLQRNLISTGESRPIACNTEDNPGHPALGSPELKIKPLKKNPTNLLIFLFAKIHLTVFMIKHKFRVCGDAKYRKEDMKENNAFSKTKALLACFFFLVIMHQSGG